MSRFSIIDESFEDLDNSLDKALQNASQNVFNYTSNKNISSSNSRQSSHGSGIPLASLRHGSMDEEEYNDVDETARFGRDQTDNTPLISSSNYRSFNSSSPTNLNTPTSRFKQIVSKALYGLKKTLFSNSGNHIKLNRSSSNESLPTLADEPSNNDLSHNQRFVSPRSNIPNKYPSNAVSNAKYNPITFVPVILYEQFKFFFNLYFLLVALSQIVPQLRIGYLSSYIVPLGFVLTVTMLKEALDDITRRKRDKEQNNELFEVLNRNYTNSLPNDPELVTSSNLKVGDLIRIHKGSRIPADLVLLQCTESGDGNGESFIKTDQLDGETDWKLRISCTKTQSLSVPEILNNVSLIVNPPAKSIHSFNGKLIYKDPTSSSNETFPLNIDQTMWANTVLASGSAIGIVIYTGPETRQAMNTTMTGVKTGLLELEINKLSKILCILVFVLSIVLVLAKGIPLPKTWYIDILRYLILFSTIIPVSLRVNLDLAKSVYASKIQSDIEIDDTIVRTSTIPEDLGRIEYLLSDKTGTLTQNEMEMKKLHLGSISYAGDTLDIVADYVASMMSVLDSNTNSKKKDLSSKVCDLILTLVLCHNVTPTFEEDDIGNDWLKADVTYQAASPDEIAIIKFIESVGLKLIKRDRNSMSILHMTTNQILNFKILYNFPFNSDTKRMGIVVRDDKGEVWFMEKGADTVMGSIVSSNDWLDEETSNMAREGLRTLVIGRKKLSKAQFQDFEYNYGQALVSMIDRETKAQKAISSFLEKDLDLLGVTGVEDKLQEDVRTSIELLRNAGIKIWMLTGDKVETAKCIGISTRLISRGQYIHQITKLNDNEFAINQLEYLKTNQNCCLLIDGESLTVYMKYFKEEFFRVVINLPSVIACRCTPQQKADVAILIKEFTGKRVCCIGDGGNDVSMIQCADVGIGIVGKEGKQASLAADFSINQFCFLSKLLLWHGRNSYKNSAKLGQFIIHRGLLISVCQAIFSITLNFEPLALYEGWLMVGYATVYTMAPVFSLVLDADVDEYLTKLYPELYKDLLLGKSLSYKSFGLWCLISFYQGLIIQLFAQFFQGTESSMVSISFTALVLNELCMVALQIHKWKKVMSVTLFITICIYCFSVPFLTEYIDIDYMVSFTFIWQIVVILSLSLIPVWILQALYRKLNPPSYAKVQQS